MSSEEERTERRDRALDTRQAHAKIATILTTGPAYCETIRVKFTDRQEHDVMVHVLSTADVQAAFEGAGADLRQMTDINEIPLAAKLKLMQITAIKATRIPDIAENLWPLEDSKIAMKAFEISGLAATPGSPKAD